MTRAVGTAQHSPASYTSVLLNSSVQHFWASWMVYARAVFSGHYDVEILIRRSTGQAAFQIVVERQYTHILGIFTPWLNPYHIVALCRAQGIGTSQMFGR